MGTASPKKAPRTNPNRLTFGELEAATLAAAMRGAFAARPAFLALAMLVVAIAPSAVVDSTAALVRVRGNHPFAVPANLSMMITHPAPKNASNNP